MKLRTMLPAVYFLATPAFAEEAPAPSPPGDEAPSDVNEPNRNEVHLAFSSVVSPYSQRFEDIQHDYFKGKKGKGMGMDLSYLHYFNRGMDVRWAWQIGLATETYKIEKSYPTGTMRAESNATHLDIGTRVRFHDLGPVNPLFGFGLGIPTSNKTTFKTASGEVDVNRKYPSGYVHGGLRYRISDETYADLLWKVRLGEASAQYFNLGATYAF